MPATEIRNLYRQCQRAARGFEAYNFRAFAIRKTRDEFRAHSGEKDPERIADLVKEAKLQRDMMRRCVTIAKLYPTDQLVVQKSIGVNVST